MDVCLDNMQFILLLFYMLAHNYISEISRQPREHTNAFINNCKENGNGYGHAKNHVSVALRWIERLRDELEFQHIAKKCKLVGYI